MHSSKPRRKAVGADLRISDSRDSEEDRLERTEGAVRAGYGGRGQRWWAGGGVHLGASCLGLHSVMPEEGKKTFRPWGPPPASSPALRTALVGSEGL